MRADGARVDPKKAAMRAAGDKFAIQFRYSSTELDLNKSTFRAALHKSSHRQNECWINALFEHYGETLLRSDKSKNMITRKDILKIIGKTEENIQDGVTIQDMMPFFVKYKLRLRVYDIFYNQIAKYDPEVLNSSQKPFFGITDGNHIYSLDRDLDSLGQKTDETDYKVTASANFRTPKDNEPPEKADYRMIEHVDEILQILRESKSSAEDTEEEEEEDEEVGKKKKRRRNII